MRHSSLSWHLIIHWVLSESLCVLPFTSAMPRPAMSSLSFLIWFITELPDRSFFLPTFAFLVHSLHGVKSLYLEEEKKERKSCIPTLLSPPQKSSVTCTVAWHLPVGLEFLPGPSRTAFQLILGIESISTSQAFLLCWVWYVLSAAATTGLSPDLHAQPRSSFPHPPPCGWKSVLPFRHANNILIFISSRHS